MNAELQLTKALLRHIPPKHWDTQKKKLTDTGSEGWGVGCSPTTGPDRHTPQGIDKNQTNLGCLSSLTSTEAKKKKEENVSVMDRGFAECCGYP